MLEPILSEKKKKKKDEITPFTATRMQLERLMLRDVSQKEKYSMISLICGIGNTTLMNVSMKQKQTHRHREQTGGDQGVGEGRRR